MADEVQVVVGGDAPEARWSLNKLLTRVRSLPRNVKDYCYSHPILENMREQEIGKILLGVVVPVFAGVPYLKFKISDPNGILFDFIVPMLLAGGVALFIGLLFRDTYRRLAHLLQLLGIVFVCLSITGLFASFLSGPALIIPGFCAAMLVLMIPFLRR